MLSHTDYKIEFFFQQHGLCSLSTLFPIWSCHPFLVEHIVISQNILFLWQHPNARSHIFPKRKKQLSSFSEQRSKLFIGHLTTTFLPSMILFSEVFYHSLFLFCIFILSPICTLTSWYWLLPKATI